MTLPDLTPTEEEALKSYKGARPGPNGETLCFGVNDKLRAGYRIGDFHHTVQEHIQALDRVFQRAPGSERELTLYRGLGSCDFSLFRQDASLRNLSFWSASTSRTAAIGFIKSVFSAGWGAVLTLRIPPGTPLYDMETLEGAGRSEREVLLPRGLLWTVTSMRAGDLNDIPMPARSSFASIVEFTMVVADTAPKPFP